MTNKNTKLVDFRFMTDDELKVMFSEKLRALMNDRQMSIVELSRLSRISEKTIRSYLQAKTVSNISRAMDICDALECEPNDLI